MLVPTFGETRERPTYCTETVEYVSKKQIVLYDVVDRLHSDLSLKNLNGGTYDARPKEHLHIKQKDPDAIVYTDADKRIIRLTREDFDSETDFLKWKEWSDANYHEEEKQDHIQANHVAPLSDTSGATDGPEIIVEQRFETLAKEQYTAETVIRIKGQLTEKQFRRLWMYCVEGLTQQEIAKREGKTHQGISKSINAAMKKLLKLFVF